jgi:hypothetical protein
MLKRSFAALALAGALLLGCTLTALAQTASTSVSIIPNSAAYSAGNCLTGNGLATAITVPNAIAPAGTGGTTIVSFSVADSSGQDAPIDFLVFRKQPTGTYTDHGACTLTTTDAAFYVGTISVSAYKTYGTVGVASLQSVNLSLNNNANGVPVGQSFWILPVVQGTPTYGSSQTLTVTFGLRGDGS